MKVWRNSNRHWIVICRMMRTC